MQILNDIKERAKQNPKRIVFPEGNDDRIIQAVRIIKDQGLAEPIVLQKDNEAIEKAKALGVPFHDIDVITITEHFKFNEYASQFFEMRKHKGVTLEQAKVTLAKRNYYGTMMVHVGDADGLVGGATYTTADTIRPALQIIKAKEKFHRVSSFFLMILDERRLIFADAAIEVDPDAKDLAEIALDTARNAKKFGIEPKVAMLSFSTKGSAKHPRAEKVSEATSIAKYKNPDLLIDGELQVDAALLPHIAERKCPDSPLKGSANVLIFPDLGSANIAYKLVERLAKAKAVGPILQGLNKPVNDLSRGCSVNDVVDVTAITVVEAQGE
ncbi:phosphate acetyltransferase [Candidatus Woesearchaeota archaeon]|nr:phosphate acetyltransferase [Candidatus Woesearchaeota archaeon]